MVVDENLLARPMAKIRCFLCKKPSARYFFHVIERTMKDRRPLPFPRGMEFFTVKNKVITAGFPVCLKCAPQCRRCHLARVTDEVREDFRQIYKDWNSPLDKVTWGKGICACTA
jgi:hypothetical protein